jgi:hypothetical protein
VKFSSVQWSSVEFKSEGGVSPSLWSILLSGILFVD